MKSEPRQNKLLIADDDINFCSALGRAMQRRGFEVISAYEQQTALQLARQHSPHYAIVDLRLGPDSGLELIQQLLRLQPDIYVLVLTGYASIATAVEAIKLGAVHYLTKPAEPDDIFTALTSTPLSGNPGIEVAREPMTVRRLEWEHIQHVLQAHNGNISAAARTLKMHRRTLQRKLMKRPVSD